ncbi:carotenoid oxygenase family protein [Streptomyces sp. NPDC091215]|uniref:carotenoid oxygenase family protein n=1 Tax=Streptomyces sp. NPDC091215 TaxID=3155192 RepID=UPI00342079C6
MCPATTTSRSLISCAADRGYLLSLRWNRAAGLTELLVHDASDLRRTLLGRVGPPSRVAFGFHDGWADRTTLDRAIVAHRTDGR